MKLTLKAKTSAILYSLVAAVFVAGVGVYDVVVGHWLLSVLMFALAGVNVWCLNRNLSER